MTARADITQDDMHAFAATLWRLGADEPEIGLIALGCAIRNRLEAAGGAQAESLASVCGRLTGMPGANAPDYSDPAFRQSLAMGCRVWNDEFADPTSGATRFHRHDELPAWAANLEPVALLGSRFYYLPDGA